MCITSGWGSINPEGTEWGPTLKQVRFPLFFSFRIYIPKTTITTVSTVHSYVSLLALGEIKKNTQDNDGQLGIRKIMIVNQECTR